ncbi:cellular nucleic acid-binding protein [Reticulomyxa filosa]|uniref:Cellular nucleic acid-binding protein n=1 Tax=Reticulomyxa filosa TaxID=46433 RepID=X6M7C4_RETFI|nr:cellular nucleic acid-binding protein [Reticulomyxa filosa]|eukprot:ETO08915.1 cellular nucleic acid-binding protein [Reticulomyxa filosa]
MPIAMVTLSKPEEVMKILQDKEIQIGYAIAQAVIYDKNKSRPKHHFKQCRNCFKLNHIAKECPQKRKTCKYCGLKNHETSKCRHKNDPSRYRCVLCKKKHPSDSVQCEVIRKAREKLGIKLTRKETVLLKKKDNVQKKEQQKEKQ